MKRLHRRAATLVRSLFSDPRMPAFLLVCLFGVFLGDGKQGVVDAFIAAGIIFLSMLNNGSHQGKRQKTTTEVALWAVVLLYVCIRTALSTVVGMSVYVAMRWMVAYIVYSIFSGGTDRRTAEKLLGAMRVLAACVAALSFIVWAIPSLRDALPPMNLVYSVFGHIHSSGIIYFVYPYALWRWLQGRSMLRLAEAAFLLFGIFFSHSRAAIALVLVVSPAVFLVSAKSRGLTRGAIIALVLLIVSALGLFVYIESSRTSTIFGRVVQKSPIFSDARLEYWYQAASSITTSPLFGTGPGTFSTQSLKYQRQPGKYSWFSHNYALGTLAEMGAVGAALVCVLIVMLAIRGNRVQFAVGQDGRRLIGPPQLLFVGAVSILLLSFVDFVFEFYVIWLLFWASLGVLNSGGGAVAPPKVIRVFDSLLGILPIFLLGAFYALVFAGLLIRPFGNNVTLAFYLTPFSAESAVAALGKSREQRVLSEALEKTVLFFHNNDDSVLYDLARAYESTGQNGKQGETLAKLVRLNRKEERYHEGLLRHLYLTNRYDGISSWMNDYVDNFLPAPIAERAKNTPLPTGGGYVWDMHDFAVLFDSRYDHETRLAKLYYLIGLRLIHTDPRKSDAYWAFSQDLMPGLSYFYVERASLAKYTLLDDGASLSILGRCVENEAARDDCSRYVARTLPQPGSLATKVERFPE